jgi:AcrR family transcriptional regulator
MSVNQNDLRVIKTKRGLREAFVRLLLQKGYDAISIQDIATEAQAARVTFYRHYKDKEELLVDCLNVIYEEISKRIKQVSKEDIQKGYSPMLVFYEHILEEEVLYGILFSSRGTQVVIERLRKLFADRIKIQIEERIPAEQLRVPSEIIAYHSAGAQIGLAVWWLENDKPYPPEYMAQISLWLSMGGIPADGVLRNSP